jgi:Ulp1 protease family, C-terminal catalytic domain
MDSVRACCRCLSIQELEDESWLSSSLIDLTLLKLASEYDQCFVSVAFIQLALSSSNQGRNAKKSPLEYSEARDIKGDSISLGDGARPISIVFNCNHVHWNMLHVRFNPPAVELFEPMGETGSRQASSRGGKAAAMSFRKIPKEVIDWLDVCCPLPGKKASWISVASSRITTPVQLTGYDCGVAALLYAEAVAAGLNQKAIENINQNTITEYRHTLQEFTKQQSAHNN